MSRNNLIIPNPSDLGDHERDEINELYILNGI